MITRKRKTFLLGLLGAATAAGMVLGATGVISSAVGEPLEVNAEEGSYYQKVVSSKADWTGDYLIVYENGNSANIMNGNLSSSAIKSGGNYLSSSITQINGSNAIKWSQEIELAEFSIEKVDSNYYSVKSKSNGYYVGNDGTKSGIYASSSPFSNTILLNGSIDIAGKADLHLKFNSQGDGFFRYYKSGQNAIQLYEYVSAATLPDFDRLEVTGTFNTNYLEGDSLNLAGMVVTAFYSDGSSKGLGTEEYTVSPSIGTPLKTTDTSFTITYTYRDEQYTISQPITVEPRVLETIAVTKKPTKVNYVVGQSLDTTGIVVTGTYEGGATADLTADCTFSPLTFDTIGEQTVTVTHTPSGLTTEFTVNVTDRKINDLSLTNKTDAFDEGDTFTLGDDAKLVANWNDGSTEDLTIDDEGVLVELFSNISGKPGEGKAIDSSYVLTTEDSGSYVGISYLGISAKKYQISVREIVDLSHGKFVKIDSISDLQLGDSFILVGSVISNEKESWYALGSEQNESNRSAINIEISDDSTISLTNSSGVEIISLENGLTEGTYALSVSGGYLYAAGEIPTGSKNQNYLRTEDSLDEGARGDWIIVESAKGDPVFQSETSLAKSRWLKFNAASKIFSCYTSVDAMDDAFIYKFVSDKDAVLDFVDTYMHMSDYNDNENKCYGVDGYYAKAKEALVKLTDEQIELFKTDSEFADAHARYLAWAAANGDNSPYSGEYVSPALSIRNPDDLMDIAIISALAIAGIAAAGAFVFLRRKKEA